MRARGKQHCLVNPWCTSSFGAYWLYSCPCQPNNMPQQQELTARSWVWICSSSFACWFYSYQQNKTIYETTTAKIIALLCDNLYSLLNYLCILFWCMLALFLLTTTTTTRTRTRTVSLLRENFYCCCGSKTWVTSEWTPSTSRLVHITSN
jgi:hypothetical protein